MAETIDVAAFQAQKAYQDQQDAYRKGSIRPGLLDGERRRSSVTDAKIKLNSGHYIPVVALGVYKAPNDSTTEDAVKWAFEAGYRHVDSGTFFFSRPTHPTFFFRSPRPGARLSGAERSCVEWRN